jgi:regulator of replication initiation timing
MEEQTAIRVELISDADWERAPTSIKQLVKGLLERVGHLEQQIEELWRENQRIIAENEQLRIENQQLRIENEQLRIENQHLQEQLNRNSSNSSRPPSQDAPRSLKPKPKEKSGKARGGQPGHAGHCRKLYPPEQCQRIEEHYPATCWRCGSALSGEDPVPQRCQIVELPPLVPIVTEHRFHALDCACCGERTRAFEAEIVNGSGYGERLTALVGLLSGEYRHSHGMVERLLKEAFAVEISVGSINSLRQEMSEAVAEPVIEAQVYVQNQPTVGSDETSFRQGNADGQNPTGKRAWLWVVVTPWVCYFQVWLSRSQSVAKTMVGADFSGNVISERYGAYNWLEVQHRQVCWAHLKRDFTQIAERPGVSGDLGKALLEQEKQLFECWYRVRDGTLTRIDFMAAVAPIQAQIHALLQQGADYDISNNEKTPLAKTVRTCRKLLKLEPAFWLFVHTEGVEPTNNDSERALRPAVLWRHSSLGSQSAAGSLFVGRMLTVVTTLRLQGRNVLDYLTEACRAKRQGNPAPSLLPNTSIAVNLLPSVA